MKKDIQFSIYAAVVATLAVLTFGFVGTAAGNAPAPEDLTTLVNH